MKKEEFIKKYSLHVYPNSIELSSKNIKEGDLFFAIKGKFNDGHDFIEEALEKGAVIVMGENVPGGRKNNVSFIKVNEQIEALNEISYDYYEDILEQINIFGITGTNGKTSTTYFLREIFNVAGIKSSLIGTIKHIIADIEYSSSNTTPFSCELFKLLAESHSKGVDNIIMEVSSHSLKEERVYGLIFNGIVLTNITKDHLDYHKDLDDYIASKRMIFDHMDNDSYAVVNMDCPVLRSMVSQQKDAKIVKFGKHELSDLRIVDSGLTRYGSEYTFSYEGKIYSVNLRMTGEFSIYNSLGAIAVSMRSGIDIVTAIKGVQSLPGVPGRFELINAENFCVVIDYAHTIDALENLLVSALKIPHSRIITVFGAGGDRDRTKRPIMGKVASEFSDIVIVTSDNPRTENPETIINDIVQGIDRNNYKVIPDRREAIRSAIGMALEKDIVIIAGKGHEDYQIIGNTKYHFSDREEVERIINEDL